MTPSDRPQYDPRTLLNSQQLIITVIDPVTYKVVFQNQTSQAKFGDISSRTCHEHIAGCEVPCTFCKLPKTIETGLPTASEVPLPNDEHLLVQWSKVQTTSGETHIVETITDITDLKRQQAETDRLVKKLSATNRDLIQANQLLQDQSVRDSLTGLYNHSHFEQTLKHLCALALRAMRPLSLLFVDLDNFKQINDLYGHTTGDQVLREIGWLLDSQQGPDRGIARASDFAARYGGEEFALILPDTSMDGALSAAERLRLRVTTLTMLPELSALKSRSFSLTCSVGVASFPIHAGNPNDLVVAADNAVYAAKRAGKNCVRMAVPAAPPPPASDPLVGS
ncbi:putative Diguanylate cyclase [Nitrospira sp. KM1]|uniref:sensor domain-containing diguanylate cyclase n=1 Tax=Nitrospira sp. KM1 TaxID=1936990 RepID=UPI0013A75686|nr:GGDEF domain-containing protein [Nitrospira sp. KM1]BCA54682.1 putative Diguanylate cyclase [Nitrospira sp. KM1]